MKIWRFEDIRKFMQISRVPQAPLLHIFSHGASSYSWYPFSHMKLGLLSEKFYQMWKDRMLELVGIKRFSSTTASFNVAITETTGGIRFLLSK